MHTFVSRERLKYHQPTLWSVDTGTVLRCVFQMVEVEPLRNLSVTLRNPAGCIILRLTLGENLVMYHFTGSTLKHFTYHFSVYHFTEVSFYWFTLKTFFVCGVYHFTGVSFYRGT